MLCVAYLTFATLISPLRIIARSEMDRSLSSAIRNISDPGTSRLGYKSEIAYHEVPTKCIILDDELTTCRSDQDYGIPALRNG